jgi:hypothetical protein
MTGFQFADPLPPHFREISTSVDTPCTISSAGRTLVKVPKLRNKRQKLALPVRQLPLVLSIDYRKFQNLRSSFFAFSLSREDDVGLCRCVGIG